MSATNLAMSVETIAVENLKVLVVATEMSLTPSERIVADRLHSEGAAVYRTGWPDFLVVRADGRIEFVEVKSGVASLFVWKKKWRILPVGEVHDQPAAWQAATGGTRHGQQYQGRCASAGP